MDVLAWNISATEHFGTWIFWHLAKAIWTFRHRHFGTFATVPKCPCAKKSLYQIVNGDEMFMCRNNYRAETCICQNVQVMKYLCRNVSSQNVRCQNGGNPHFSLNLSIEEVWTYFVELSMYFICFFYVLGIHDPRISWLPFVTKIMKCEDLLYFALNVVEFAFLLLPLESERKKVGICKCCL
jgi:hypothetical protein